MKKILLIEDNKGITEGLCDTCLLYTCDAADEL